MKTNQSAVVVKLEKDFNSFVKEHLSNSASVFQVLIASLPYLIKKCKGDTAMLH